jgi:hypothetical protein
MNIKNRTYYYLFLKSFYATRSDIQACALNKDLVIALQLKRVLQTTRMRAHSWLQTRKIKSFARFWVGAGKGLAFYDKNALAPFLTEQQQKEIGVVTIPEFCTMVGMTQAMLSKIIKNNNFECAFKVKVCSNLIRAYEVDALFDLVDRHNKKYFIAD